MRRDSRRAAEAVAALVASVVLLVLTASPAAAHTEFQSSDPADGAVVSVELARITISFTAQADPAGEGFVILDSGGLVRAPDTVESVDGMTWVLTFAEPIPNGPVGVRWTVQAPDAHPIEGSFSFTVDAPVPATPEPQPTAAPAPTPTLTPELTPEPAEETDLATFLEARGGPDGAAGVSRAGSVLTVGGAIAASGVLAFAAFALEGHVRSPGAWQVALVSAIALLAGAVVSLAAQVAALAGSWTAVRPSDVADVISTEPGVALLFRIGAGLVIGWAMAESLRGPAHGGRRVIPSGVGAEAARIAVRTRPSAAGPTPVLVVGGVGALLAVASFAFDGHTVSEGPRVVHAVANVVHVSTGAIWAGGAGMLAYLSRRPHASPQPISVAAARFSVLATWAVAAVALSGITMSAIVVDGPSDLWTTGWGPLLLAKVAAVGAIGVLGLHNHRVVVPGLTERPDDDALLADLRRTTIAEAGLFVLVLVLTGFLVLADAT